MHIISPESINSSPIPQFQKPTFRRAKPLSSKLNIPPPLFSRRSAHPPPSQISLCNSATQVAIITNTAQTAPYTPEKDRRGRRILCYLLWGRILRGGKQSDSPAVLYVENTQKKLDSFHAITHSFTSTTSSDKRFRRGVSNFPAEKNTRSHSAEVGGMECTSCAH